MPPVFHSKHQVSLHTFAKFNNHLPSFLPTTSPTALVRILRHLMRSMEFIKRAFLAVTTCLFSLGGALVGLVGGGVIGSATETGLVRGCGIGVVSGVIIALELFDSLVDGRFMSKAFRIGKSLFNGKVFTEWVCPAMLKAYQSQIDNLSLPDNEELNLYSLDDGPKGLTPKVIDDLPTFRFRQCPNICCTICMEDYKDGESGRELRSCGHFFHKGCIDSWLGLRGSCPVCRQLVTSTSCN